MVEGQGLPAAGAEADVVSQPVEQDLVDLVCHPLPAVVELVLVHRAVEGLGKGEVEVQLPVVQLQLRQGDLPLRLSRLLNGLPPLPAVQELEEQLPQGLLRLVKGDVGRPQLLLLGEQEPHLPHLGDDGDVPGDVQLAVGLHRGHLVPLGQDLQQVEVHLEHQVGEAHHRVLEGRHHRLQPGPDQLQVLGGSHIPLGIHAVPARPACDLPDLLRLQRPAFHPVELLRVHEDDPPDGQVQPHADGVGGHDILHLPLQEPLHLPAAGGVGQGPVDDGWLLAALAQVLRHAEHPHLGEGDEGVPGLHPLVVDGVGHAYQRGGPLVLLHLIGVPAALDEADEQVLGLRGGAQVDLRGQHSQDGPGPGVPPLGVGDHLALVDDRHVIAPLQGQLLRRGGHVGVPLPEVLLLPGGQAAVHPGVQQGLLGLQGQQPQGGQIDPRPGPDEPLESGVGLARVGAPQVEDKAAAHGPGLRVLVLGVQGDEQGQAGADGLWHIPHRPDGPQPLQQQLPGRKALRLEKTLHVGLRLLIREVCQRLPGGSPQHIGIAGVDLPGERVVRVLPQPAPRLEEVLQNLGQAPAVAPLLQGQKLPQPGRRLGGAHSPPLRPGGKPVQDSPVVVLRQPPGCPAVRLRRLPGPPQRPADRLHIPGLALPTGAPAVSSLGKLGGALRPAHVLLAPGPDEAPVKGQIAGLRQQLPDQSVGPPPPLQQGGGPVFSSAASRHGAFSSLLCSRSPVQYSRSGQNLQPQIALPLPAAL